MATKTKAVRDLVPGDVVVMWDGKKRTVERLPMDCAADGFVRVECSKRYVINCHGVNTVEIEDK